MSLRLELANFFQKFMHQGILFHEKRSWLYNHLSREQLTQEDLAHRNQTKYCIFLFTPSKIFLLGSSLPDFHFRAWTSL